MLAIVIFNSLLMLLTAVQSAPETANITHYKFSTVDHLMEPVELRTRSRIAKTYEVYIMAKVNWYSAVQICNFQGMQLATITSQIENQQLLEYLTRKELTRGRDAFWTSGSALADGRKWVWLSSGLPVLYTNWDSDEPSDFPHDDCVEYLPNGRWSAYDCLAERYFVCENRCR